METHTKIAPSSASAPALSAAGVCAPLRCALVGLAVVGSLAGQQDLKRITNTVNVGGHLYFAGTRASGHAELWVLANGKAPARMVKDVHAGPNPSRIHGILALGQSAVFVADDGKHGAELWKSDGTPKGTSMILDLTPGVAGSGIDLQRGALRVGKALYFFTRKVAGGISLWVTDGTKKGAKIVQSFPDAVGKSVDHRMTLLTRGVVVFQVVTAKGRQVWRTDGTANGTSQLADVVVGDGTGPFGRIGDRLFFAGGVGDAWDIWLTDGSKSGTKQMHVAPAAAAAVAVTAKERRLAKIHFKTYCVTCHGAKGRGKGPAAIALNPKPRDWTDPKWQASVTDDRILKVIRDGGAAVGLSPLMAPNPMYQKNAPVMQALVELVRSFNKKK